MPYNQQEVRKRDLPIFIFLVWLSCEYSKGIIKQMRKSLTRISFKIQFNKVFIISPPETLKIKLLQYLPIQATKYW